MLNCQGLAPFCRQMTENEQATSSKDAAANPFYPAKPSKTLLGFVHSFNRLDLSWRNKVMVPAEDLERLAKVPAGQGIVLTPNHADEMDPRVCFEVSRRANRQMIFMCNREAFLEMGGLAGKLLQGIGAFSVERGGKDTAAKVFAGSVVKGGKDVLVIFPEGEIFYLNQSVQPFHSGAIDIGIQSIIDQRKTNKDWTAYLLPMSIKYHYLDPLHDIMDKRVSKMEFALSKGMTGSTLHSRLRGVAEELIIQKELTHQLSECTDEESYEELDERINKLRHSLLDDVSSKHKDSYRAQARTLDKAFQIGAHLRERLSKTGSADHQSEYAEDLDKLKEVKHLVSLQPEYVEADPSPERLAEMIIKLEREIFGVQRPKQLGRREVFIRIGTPIDLSQYINIFLNQPHELRRSLADQLRTEIQKLIDAPFPV